MFSLVTSGCLPCDRFGYGLPSVAQESADTFDFIFADMIFLLKSDSFRCHPATGNKLMPSFTSGSFFRSARFKPWRWYNQWHTVSATCVFCVELRTKRCDNDTIHLTYKDPTHDVRLLYTRKYRALARSPICRSQWHSFRCSKRLHQSSPSW